MTISHNTTQGVVFITGGATGIGAASVKLFAANGWQVAFIDINDNAAAELIENHVPEALYVHADTRDFKEVEAAVAACIERFGRIDSVFANAGIHRRNTILDISEEEFDLVVKTNIYGTFHTLRATVPHLKANGGTIVINASDQSVIGKRGNFAYGLTKGALGQITKNLSADLAPFGIRVNAVCPGTIKTPLVDKLFESVSLKSGMSVEELWAEEDALFERGSAGTAEEVAELVYFLAGNRSSFCTGGLFPVDGGLTAVR